MLWCPGSRVLRHPQCLPHDVCELARVVKLPSARAAPSRACRADDNSPTCTNLSARAARNSKSSTLLLRYLLLHCAVCSSQTRLASINCDHASRVKASDRATNSRDVIPAPANRCCNMRGNIKKTFHPRATLSLSTPFNIFSKTIFIAFQPQRGGSGNWNVGWIFNDAHCVNAHGKSDALLLHCFLPMWDLVRDGSETTLTHRPRELLPRQPGLHHAHETHPNQSPSHVL